MTLVSLPVEASAPGPFLTDVPGRMVDSAPGVTTPGEFYEVMPKVWVFIPTEYDPNDPKVVPPVPQDAEVLSAYVRGVVATYDQFINHPDSTEPTSDYVATFGREAVDHARRVIPQRVEQGVRMDMRSGDVFRPRVLSNGRTSTVAFILDCQWITSVDYYSSSGEIVEGNVDALRPVPFSVKMVKDDGRWVIGSAGRYEDAC